jgi:hypothetical protein
VFHTAITAAGLASDEERRLTLAQSAQHDPEGGTAFSEAFPPQNVLNLLTRRQPALTRQHRLDQKRRAVCSGRHKLIRTGDEGVELFDMHADPAEKLNLAAMLPEQVEPLDELLEGFMSGTSALAHAAERGQANDDPLVRRRLHDLGYLE